MSYLCAELLNSLNSRKIARFIRFALTFMKSCNKLPMTIAATFAGAVSMLSNLTLFSCFGSSVSQPRVFCVILLLDFDVIKASLTQITISWRRENKAAIVAAEICCQPLWLVFVLVKTAGAIDNQSYWGKPVTAHMFIINPVHRRSIDNLISTHRNNENRTKHPEFFRVNQRDL